MQDKERETLKGNAEELANLLTENVPYLLSHYLQSGVLTEAERENIIQASSAYDIKVKLITTLASKEEISLDAIIDGLNATENHCVAKEINNLLVESSTEEMTDNGSGDRPEDVSRYATNLVDEVIAKAEKTTEEQSATDEDDFVEEKTTIVGAQVKSIQRQQLLENRDSSSTTNEHGDAENQMKEEIADKLVETNVEIHTSSMVGNENNVGVNNESLLEDKDIISRPSISDSDVNGEFLEYEIETPSDVQDKSVNFPSMVMGIDDQSETEMLSYPTSPVTLGTADGTQSPMGDGQNESENEDVDNIDIEKEFVMPPEVVSNVNNHSISNGKSTTNGDTVSSKSALFSNGKKADDEKKTEGIEDTELAAILAKKALVKQQVQLFEKNAPGEGKVKYSIGAAAGQDKDPQNTGEGSGTNVKNLKNFFQRLSTNETTASTPSSGPARSVGKLKVTFPATS